MKDSIAFTCYSRWEVLPSAPLLQNPACDFHRTRLLAVCGNVSYEIQNPLIKTKHGLSLVIPNLSLFHSGSVYFYRLGALTFVSHCIRLSPGQLQVKGFGSVRIVSISFTHLCPSIIFLPVQLLDCRG